MNERETSSPDCKQASGVMHCLLHMEFHSFNSRIDEGYHNLVRGVNSNFLETVWVPLMRNILG